MLKHCCLNASPRHRDIEKKCPRSIVAKKHRRYIVEQRRTIGEHSVRYTKVKNVAAISATFPTCSCKHRRCLHGLFDVIISSMVWVIHGRCSPMFPNCPAKHRRCYGDALLGVFYFFSASSNTPTEQKWPLLHPRSHPATTRYMVPRKISHLFICSPHVALYYRHDFVKT